MKKNTIAALYTYFTANSTAIDSDSYADIVNEYEKTVSVSNEKNAAYAAAWEIVQKILSDGTERTANQIFTEGAEEFAAIEFTIGKIQYGLLHQWKDAVIKNDNGKNPKTYLLK